MPDIRPDHVAAFVAGTVAGAVIWWLTTAFLDRNGARFGVGDGKGIF